MLKAIHGLGWMNLWTHLFFEQCSAVLIMINTDQLPCRICDKVAVGKDQFQDKILHSSWLKIPLLKTVAFMKCFMELKLNGDLGKSSRNSQTGLN